MNGLIRHRTFGVALVASLAIVAAIAASGALSAGAPNGPFTKVSNQGTPFNIPAAQKHQMGLDAYPTVAQLSAANGERYLRFAGNGAHDCYGSGPANGALPIGVLKCVSNSPFFPSAANPILDLSVVQVDANGSSSYVRVSGVAADGVAQIGILDAAGNIAQTIPVVGNVYDSADINSGTVAALVALDANGAIVARVPGQP